MVEEGKLDNRFRAVIKHVAEPILDYERYAPTVDEVLSNCRVHLQGLRRATIIFNFTGILEELKDQGESGEKVWELLETLDINRITSNELIKEKELVGAAQ